MIHRKDSDHHTESTIWERLAEPKPVWDTVEDYCERLDAVCPGEWDCTFEKIEGYIGTFKCRVQILGVIREGIGADDDAHVASELAFAKACLMFGLGKTTTTK